MYVRHHTQRLDRVQFYTKSLVFFCNICHVLITILIIIAIVNQYVWKKQHFITKERDLLKDHDLYCLLFLQKWFWTNKLV